MADQGVSEVNDTEFVHFEVIAERPRRRRTRLPLTLVLAGVVIGGDRRGHEVARVAHTDRRRDSCDRARSAARGGRECRHPRAADPVSQSSAITSATPDISRMRRTRSSQFAMLSPTPSRCAAESRHEDRPNPERVAIAEARTVDDDRETGGEGSAEDLVERRRALHVELTSQIDPGPGLPGRDRSAEVRLHGIIRSVETGALALLTHMRSRARHRGYAPAVCVEVTHVVNRGCTVPEKPERPRRSVRRTVVAATLALGDR